jgi:hypothetical protein
LEKKIMHNSTVLRNIFFQKQHLFFRKKLVFC